MTEPIDRRAALYARVSTEQQAQEDTIASQLDLLRRRIQADGLTVAQELQFADDGYSGETFRRPALERLRDTAAAGAIDRIYIECPDRLARDYPYQMVVVDELRRQGVEVVFLNHDLDESPEGRLLLQVQGIIAEYERVKAREKCRRGRLYAARSGQVSVLGGALRIPLPHQAGGRWRGPVCRPVRRGPGGPRDLHLGGDRRMFAQSGVPTIARTRAPYPHGQGAVGIGPRSWACCATRLTWGQPTSTRSIASRPVPGSPASGSPRVSTATHRQSGDAPRGPDPDPGAGDRGAGPVRGRAGAAGGAPPTSRPGGPPAAPSAGGLGGVPAVWLRVSRSGHEEEGRESLWLLPLLWGGGRVLRRPGPDLRQSGDPDRTSGRGGVVRCARVVAGAGAVG